MSSRFLSREVGLAKFYVTEDKEALFSEALSLIRGLLADDASLVIMDPVLPGWMHYGAPSAYFSSEVRQRLTEAL